MSEPKKSGVGTAADKANQIWGDLIPVVLFVFVYNVLRRFPEDRALFNPETSLYWATGALIIATAFLVGLKFIRKEPIPPFLIVTSLIVGGFGTLGIVLQDKTFIYYKPTIQNWFLAALIFGGFAFGRNIWKDMFKTVFDLPDFAWRTLAIRWGLFFIAMGIWNEILWRGFSEDVWANWKLGNMLVVLIFGVANTPYMLKHLQDEEAPVNASA
ncbi:MAG: inner membrane-spanning protein YciB [Pseudomonadota bacterium]